MAHFSLGAVTGPLALRPVQTQPGYSSHGTAGRRWCGSRRRHRSHPVLLPAATRAAPRTAELGSLMTPVPESVPYHGAFVARTLVLDQPYATLGAFDALATAPRQYAHVLAGPQVSCFNLRGLTIPIQEVHGVPAVAD